MAKRKDSETPSYREERGKRPAADPREGMGNVPLAPSSARVVGEPRRRGESAADADREGAAENEGMDGGGAERHEVH